MLASFPGLPMCAVFTFFVCVDNVVRLWVEPWRTDANLAEKLKNQVFGI